jgi:uncharacterized iron-regulated membrane protein
MSMVDKATSKRLLAIHGWSGVLLGLFLYVVVITGTVAVLAHEIGEWSVSGAKSEEPFGQPLDTRVKELATTVDPKFKDDLFISPNAEGSLIVFFHTHGTNKAGDPDDLGVRFLLDGASLKVLRRDQGFGAELPGDPQSALDHFISTLHISLHAPNPIGLYLTGIAGFVMLFAVISGIILHKHLIKDLFVAPRHSSRLLNRRDHHILAGSWSLPFGFLLAFTGTFFSFAGAIGLPIVAMVSFGGNQTKMLETLVGAPLVKSEGRAQMANMDTILAKSIVRAGTQPDFVNVVHWGKADAKVQVTHGPSGSSIESSNHIYSMTSGAYEGVKPDVGTKPSLGSKVFSWMGPLHFGHFAGLLSKVIWVALGLATCYVTLTGMRLWVERRADQSGWHWLERAIPMVGYGVPTGLVGSAFGFLASYPDRDTVTSTANGFLIGAALAIAATLASRRSARPALPLGTLLGAGLIGLPMMRLGMGGAGWVNLVRLGHLIPVTLDLALLVAGAGVLTMAWRQAAYPVGPSSIGSVTPEHELAAAE